MSPADVAHRIGCVVVVALLVAGCGGGTTASPDVSSGSESFNPSPTLEGEGSESPQPPDDDVSISVPTLPVGGDSDVDGVDQCGHANWLGSPIPPGVEVSVTDVALDPAGIFGLEGDPCGSDEDGCADSWTWTSDTQDDECTVSVTQLVDTDETVTLVLVGTVTCTSQSLCEEFAGSEGLFDGSQVSFTAELGLVSPGPSESASESTDSESPTELFDSDSASESTSTTED